MNIWSIGSQENRSKIEGGDAVMEKGGKGKGEGKREEGREWGQEERLGK